MAYLFITAALLFGLARDDRLDDLGVLALALALAPDFFLALRLAGFGVASYGFLSGALTTSRSMSLPPLVAVIG